MTNTGLNLILRGESQLRYYTDVAHIFGVLGYRAQTLNWLITDTNYSRLECENFPPELSDDSWTPVWISGMRLLQILQECEIQFNWGVLSGFQPDIVLDLTRLAVYPYADCNRLLWTTAAAIQHPQAVVEIVCWDSALTLFLSKDPDLSRNFQAAFPEAMDLDSYKQTKGWLEPATIDL